MLKLYLLGSTTLRGEGGRSIRSVLTQPKRLGLLVYLALQEGFCRRDTLLPLFWPHLDQEHARAALRQTTYLLRRSLGAELIVTRGDDELGLAGDGLECDVVEFRRALEREDFAAALRLYGGELLPGFYLSSLPEFERWLEGERARLRDAAALAARRLSEEAWARNDLAAAIAWSRRQLALSPADETALLQLLEQLQAAGDRVGAIRAYEDFSRELANLYGLVPSPEAERLVEVIRSPPSQYDRQPNRTGPGARLAAHSGAQPNVPPTPPKGTSGVEPAWPSPPHLPATGSAAPQVIGAGGGTAGNGRTGSRWRGWSARTLSAAAALGALGLAAIWQIPTSMGYPSRGTISVAVLPFVDLSPDAAGQYLGAGMTDELISTLGSIPGLSVASRTSVYAFEGSNLQVREIGRALRVTHVLEGTVQQNADRVRFAVRLVDVADGRQRWGELFDRDAHDVLTIRDEIGSRVAAALRPHLQRPPGGVDAGRTPDPAAYDDYLRGRYALGSQALGSHTRPQLEQAIRFFTAAAQRDPEFVRAYTGLADAYVAMTEFVPNDSVLPHARAAAERALELNPLRAESHLAFANLLLAYDLDWSGAERSYLRALELAPDLPEAHYAYARFLRSKRHFEEALRVTERGLAIERKSAGGTLGFAVREQELLASFKLGARHYDEAIRHAAQALELDGNSMSARASLSLAYQMLERHDDAVRVLEQTRTIFGDRSPALWRLADAYARAGRVAEARAVLELLTLRSADEHVPAQQIGAIHLGLGDADQALHWFETAVDRRGWFVSNLNSSPRYESLRENPRFQDLLRRINAPSDRVTTR